MTTILEEVNNNRTKNIMDLPKIPIINAIQKISADRHINIDDIIYDPCCGSGCIIETLKSYGFKNLLSSDISSESFISGEKNINVYNLEDNICDIVITRPPFSEMVYNNMLQEFFRISRKKVILLLDINFLSSLKRKEMLENSPLRHVYINSQRIVLKNHGDTKPKTRSSTMYVWCIWDKEYSGTPTLGWI